MLKKTEVRFHTKKLIHSKNKKKKQNANTATGS